MNKPKRRSRVRIFLGKLFYTTKRYAEWFWGMKNYTGTISNEKLKELYFQHQTPLFRNLPGVLNRLQENKKQNLKLACAKLSGIIIKPGEKFSYWRLIGNPSKKKGYLPGLVLFYGKLTEGTGGGLCQLSNLIYWMTLHTPLTVTERYRHSFDVFPDSNRKQPFGSGATCVYPYRDLQIYNGTNSTFQLIVMVGDKNLEGEWRVDNEKKVSYEIYEKQHSITHEKWGGYVRHNLLYRKTFNKDGEIMADEKIAENHALMMYEPFLQHDLNEKN
jgi:vancomycin resistance protein VanW